MVSNDSNPLGRLIKTGKILIAPGAYDALSALVIQRIGFNAIYVTGSGQSYSRLGMQDLGFTGLQDMIDGIFKISSRVEIPLICDADTGYGNDLNTAYTVRMYEKAGADAIQIEDQKLPKKCGHLEGKVLEEPEEMITKLKAALNTRKRAMIIARTDAVSVLGLSEAIQRANEYISHGADIAFVESPSSVEDIRVIANEVKGKKLINMVEGGKTPLVPASELEEMGYSIVIYPNAAIRSAVFSIERTMEILFRTGTTSTNLDNMYDFNTLQDLIRV